VKIKMSNSPLVNYTKISPNKTSPRNHKIDTITIHCVVGQVTVERLGEIFAPTTRKASSNYGIGLDGKIGMYVEEKDRSWCSSSASNDNRAITIEVASDTTHPYAVTDNAYNALIELVADICRRNDIKELKWKGDKSLVGQIDKQNMTVHRWFANKSCPGDYLYNLHSDIVSKVNAKLGNSSSESQKATTSQNTEPQTLYRVQCGISSTLAHAKRLVERLKKIGVNGSVIKSGNSWRVQVGAFKDRKNAEALFEKLVSSDFKDAIITYVDETIKKAQDDTIKPGDKVTVTKAVTYSGSSFKLYYTKYDVFEVKGDRAVIGIGTVVVAAVNIKNLKKA
jgi:hypothetical protein